MLLFISLLMCYSLLELLFVCVSIVSNILNLVTGLYYELVSNGVYQEMCFQEANKLNLGHCAKTFIIPVNKKHTSNSHPHPSNNYFDYVYNFAKVTNCWSGPFLCVHMYVNVSSLLPHPTPGSKNTASALMMLKAGGNLKQHSTASVLGGGVVAGTGVPSVLVGSTNSMSSKGSVKEVEPSTSKVGI